MRWAREQDYDVLIIAAATAHQLDPDLVKGLIGAESGFDPTAVGDDGASLGLMQVQQSTAAALGIAGDLTDPRTNLAAGTAYLAQQIARAGSEPGGISAYNGGYRPLSGFGKPLLTSGAYRNQAYVDRVLANWQYFRSLHPFAGSPPSPVLPMGSAESAGGVDPVHVSILVLGGLVVATVLWALLH